jgi:hypothetical protein
MHANGKGCCHDQVKIVKIQDDHQTSSVTFSFEKLHQSTSALSQFLFTEITNENVTLNKADHSPPLELSGQDIYIQNRVLRI